jgi:hypothetical protein
MKEEHPDSETSHYLNNLRKEQCSQHLFNKEKQTIKTKFRASLSCLRIRVVLLRH